MNIKAVIFVVIVVAIAAIIYFIPSGDEPKTQTSPAQTRSMSMADDHAGHNHAPLPEIDSLSVSVRDSTGADLATLTLIPNQPEALPGTDYSLHLTDFYTHFMMEDAGVVNASPHPENPAARVEVLQDGEVVDYTWIFEQVPWFRVSGMGGAHDREGTGLAFAMIEVFGLEVPVDSTPNP